VCDVVKLNYKFIMQNKFGTFCKQHRFNLFVYVTKHSVHVLAAPAQKLSAWTRGDSLALFTDVFIYTDYARYVLV